LSMLIQPASDCWPQPMWSRAGGASAASETAVAAWRRKSRIGPAVFTTACAIRSAAARKPR